MPVVEFHSKNGATRRVHVAAGTSVMQAAVNEGIEEILAQCGGACACGTCHVFIDDAWLGELDAASDNEKDMIEFVDGAAPNSRLSCQIRVTDELDGLVVHLPESQG